MWLGTDSNVVYGNVYMGGYNERYVIMINRYSVCI